MPVAEKHNGWRYDAANGRLYVYYRGTSCGYFTASGLTVAAAISSGTTVTAGTDLVATAGDIKCTAGNVRLGVISAFGTTEPTSAVVMKQGTAPVGAITTSGGIFSSATVVRKIIAAGTVTNVET